MSAATRLRVIDPEDRMRADLYDFLGVILSKSPDQTFLDKTAALQGDDTPLGQAIGMLAAEAARSNPRKAEREFNKLFIGLGRGEFLPYASYYLTGFLNEKPLAKLRADMRSRGIERASHVSEPEDNIGSLLEMMGGMIVGRYGNVTSLEGQRTFFDDHVGNWAPHFFEDLAGTENSSLYRAVGAVGAAFMTIEREAFRMMAA